VILKLDNGDVQSHLIGKSSGTFFIMNHWRRMPTQYLTDPILCYIGGVIAAVLSIDLKSALTSAVKEIV